MDELLVEDNVLYDIKGHAIWAVTGDEERN